MDRPVTVSHIRIIAPKIDASTPDGLAAAFRHGATECLMNAEELASGKTLDLSRQPTGSATFGVWVAPGPLEGQAPGMGSDQLMNRLWPPRAGG